MKKLKLTTLTIFVFIIVLSLTSCTKEHILKFQNISSEGQGRFSYSYGYYVMSNLVDSTIVVDGRYFSRGVVDSYYSNNPYFSEEEMFGYISQFASEYIQEGKQIIQPKAVTSMKGIESLPVPETLPEEFSYSYGYVTTRDVINNKIELDVNGYVQGILTVLYDIQPLYSEDDMRDYLNNYLQELNEKILMEMEAEGEMNLEIADSYLRKLREEGGYTELPSGVMLKYLVDNENGKKPVRTDSVNVDYKLELLSGLVVDQGNSVDFSLGSLIPGFVDAVLDMNVGDEVIAYIPPDLGYGLYSQDPIAPNSLLIFTIRLNSIN